MLALLLAATCALAGLQEGAVAASGRESRECPSCQGAGRREVECWLCLGQGEHPCGSCSLLIRRRPRRWTSAWLPKAVASTVVGEVLGSLERLDLADLRFPGMPTRRGRPVNLRDGEVLCPAVCIEGQTALGARWVGCAFCRGKGKVDCEACSGKGELNCERCNGERRIPLPCSDCAGTGAVLDFMQGDANTCPWCHDTRRLACGTCDDEGKEESPCRTCWGALALSCSTCGARGQVPCSNCSGRGLEPNSRHRKMDCIDCEGSGRETCASCNEGKRPCTACYGAERVRLRCYDCGGERSHPCGGCEHGAYLSWERAADWALDEGEPERAVALLEVAKERCDRRYEQSIEANLLDPVGDVPEDLREACVDALEDELRDERRRLDKLLRRARVAARR